MAAALPLLQADWPAPAGVHALTTRRHGAGISPAPFAQFNLGNRHAADGDTPANVEHNRQLLQQGLALPSAPHWLRQVHSSTVLRFDAPPVPGASEPVADAAVTSVPGVVLAILTADCLPVVFAAADGSEVGAAHAGWRGLADGMLEATVAAMQTSPAQLRAWLGPAAGPSDYEIGEEVYHAFVGHDPAAERAFVATRPGHWKVDLFALARQR
ncbi:MAG: laccase domain-containing protein, partial [Stenotrophomonas maltophilia]|nr:laccase domain-containing protein [Stenotrophomonas maltophilia]